MAREAWEGSGLALLAIFATAFVVGLSGAMVPGPLLTVTIGETLGRGPRAGMMLVIGHGLIELALVLALFAGLRELIRSAPVVALISVAGGAFLLWMAYGMISGVLGRHVSLALDSAGATGSRWGPVARGAGISVSNPYWSVWWASTGAVMMASSLMRFGVGGVAVFYVGHVLSDFAWYGLVVLILVTGRRLVSDRLYRGLLLGCGLLLVLLGLGFLYMGGGYLLGRAMPLAR